MEEIKVKEKMEKIDRAQEMVDEIFRDSSVRCPHIRRDESGAYCGKDMKDGVEISQERRNVCEIASLHLYCLRDFEKCIYYQGEEVN